MVSDVNPIELRELVLDEEDQSDKSINLKQNVKLCVRWDVGHDCEAKKLNLERNKA